MQSLVKNRKSKFTNLRQEVDKDSSEPCFIMQKKNDTSYYIFICPKKLIFSMIYSEKLLFAVIQLLTIP